MGGFLNYLFPLRRHHITLKCTVMLRISKDKTAISVLDRTWKTPRFQVWEWTRFDIHIWNQRTLNTHLPSSFWNAKTEGSVHIVVFCSDFRGRRRRFKHFKLSNFSFSKKMVLGPSHFLAYDLSWFITEVLQLQHICWASLQTTHLWTW